MNLRTESNTVLDSQTSGQQEPAQASNEACQETSEQEEGNAWVGQGTYSPDDNKLRLYPFSRLDQATYERVRGAGYIWAAKQGLFVAPAWTPEREDLLIELCGDVEDEDKSLTDRAEERAERFGEYAERRQADASRASDQADTISQQFAGGQPILIGHHSERRARREQAKMHASMSRACKMWETSDYWACRAAGALNHARHKELPTVRARRIKKLETELRSVQRSVQKASITAKLWAKEGLTRAQATTIADNFGGYVRLADGERVSLWSVLKNDDDGELVVSVEEIQRQMATSHQRYLQNRERWVTHLNFRLVYERALLEASGFVAPPKLATRAVLPLLNYGGEVRCRNRYGSNDVLVTQAVGMTKAEWAAVHNDYKGTRTSADGTHRVRSAIIRGALQTVYLTDAKQHPRPELADAETAQRVAKAQVKIEEMREARRIVIEQNKALPTTERHQVDATAYEKAKEMKNALKTGVQVVSAPQLFPTPPALAVRMVDEARIACGSSVLEPSAGTGRLLEALPGVVPFHGECRQTWAHVTAVEINAQLVDHLRRSRLAHAVHQADFLAMGPELGQFDVVLLNPPFTAAADVEHIRHAFKFVKPGGRLVALCADGPRQQFHLRGWVESMGGRWEELPQGTFASEGTNVRVALIVVAA